jgi:hypothetical protein
MLIKTRAPCLVAGVAKGKGQMVTHAKQLSEGNPTSGTINPSGVHFGDGILD